MSDITKKIYYSQYTYTESLLQDYARKGLILKDYDMNRFTFEESDPVDRRYRLVPTTVFGLVESVLDNRADSIAGANCAK